jgi:preprotein translocase subunit SecD
MRILTPAVAISLIVTASTLGQTSDTSKSYIELRAEVLPDQQGVRAYYAVSGERVRLAAEPILDMTHIAEAIVSAQPTPRDPLSADSRYGVALRLTPEGARRLARATRAMIGRRIGVLLAGELAMLGVVRAELRGPVPLTEPDLTRQRAEALAADINTRPARLRREG